MLLLLAMSKASKGKVMTQYEMAEALSEQLNIWGTNEEVRPADILDCLEYAGLSLTEEVSKQTTTKGR
jgi:hypothetical protein